MADVNNLPEAEDTKTRVTAKISADTPGKKIPQINLASASAAPAAGTPANNTMTGRTMKLQGLAGMAPVKPVVEVAAAAPAAEASDDTRTRRTVKLAELAGEPAKPVVAAPAPAAPAAAGDDTRTKRTVKLAELAGAGEPAKPVVAVAPAAPAAAPAAAGDDTRTKRTVKLAELAGAGEPAKPVIQTAAKAESISTVTRRTQKLEALDTQAVAAMEAAGDDTTTRKAVKVEPAAVATPRNTVKVGGIAPAKVPIADNGPKTIQVAGVAPATASAVKLADVQAAAASPQTIQIAAPAPADDTKTQRGPKVAPPAADAKFSSSSVDDTVKLQRPAPKPVMKGSVAPAAQGGASAVGGIKLNKPKPAPPKPVAKPEAAPAAAAPEEAPAAEAPAAAEPTGNLGKDQTPPKKRKGLKVNTDAIKDLGSSPAAAAAGGGEGAAPKVVAGNMPVRAAGESTGINVAFAIFATLAMLVLIFVALETVSDYFKIWHDNPSDPVQFLISCFKN